MACDACIRASGCYCDGVKLESQNRMFSQATVVLGSILIFGQNLTK